MMPLSVFTDKDTPPGINFTLVEHGKLADIYNENMDEAYT